METPQIPTSVLANVQQRWPEVAGSWAEHAGIELQSLCQQYQAVPREVLPARYGFVIAAESPTGPLVLRSTPDPHGPDQAAVAAALANLTISPYVYESNTTDHGTWTVLDRVSPGTALYETDMATIDLRKLFEPLAAMSHQPTPRDGMPSIIDWLRSRLEDDHLEDRRLGTAVAPLEERQHALDLLSELATDHSPRLCHGDASLGNVIADGRSGWKYIDPRGISGESAYDVAVLGLRIARVRTSAGLVDQIAAFANASAIRVHSWMTVANAARV
ncbi:hypothetical protein GCM10010435_37510 [Winogradskya consettensis]|uniref:Uncharacterized protein n=1 Tax=Winogradskya consettensis TaxID=113560 RepID=A0A919W0F3_9ACTN|nr:aminoglycoside phosphotransferase family protein [Actinoplanes consettensis]GIM83856.1 hypothetical protein Aco04nite_88580 [Actinoplanes consettensis]